MNAFTVIPLTMFLLVTQPALSQDSSMVKKPSTTARTIEQMPVRKGRGNATPMPSPRYRSRMVPGPIPRDTSRSRLRRDTTR
ncbi:hypothetical protein [uncultured Fibrella sp.]|uniref:hypothetical protein n=1 Tax=uncultured Fibrella sp. TaxID=1284596 RepID=UPI0035CBCE68